MLRVWLGEQAEMRCGALCFAALAFLFSYGLPAVSEPEALRTSSDIAHPEPPELTLKQIQKYDKQIKQNPRDAIAYYYRARNYLTMRSYPKACADFMKCMQVDPYKPGMSPVLVSKDPKLQNGKVLLAWCNQNLAYIYFVQRDYAKGVDAISKAIAIRPAYAINYKNRALGYKALGKMDLARKDAARVNQLINKPEYDDCVELPN